MREKYVEMSSNYSFENVIIAINDTHTPSYILSTTWCSLSDFSFTSSNTEVAVISANSIIGQSEGVATITATHKVSGVTSSFNVAVTLTHMLNTNASINNTIDRQKIYPYIFDNYNKTTIGIYSYFTQGNCANFASQCLKEAGLQFSGAPTSQDQADEYVDDPSRWYYIEEYGDSSLPLGNRNGVSYTWTVAENFRQYWGQQNSTTIGNCYRYVEYSSGNELGEAISFWSNELHIGDIIQFFNDDNTRAKHTMVVSTIENGIIKLSYHSSAKLDRPLDEICDDYISTKFCIIQISQN